MYFLTVDNDEKDCKKLFKKIREYFSSTYNNVKVNNAIRR